MKRKTDILGTASTYLVRYAMPSLKYTLLVLAGSSKQQMLPKPRKWLFVISRASVIEWRRNEEKLRRLGSGMQRSRGAGRKVCYPDIEEELKRRRDAGARVTGTALKTECLRCHRANSDQGFRASCGWLRRFM